jgi:hypothetical protein
MPRRTRTDFTWRDSTPIVWALPVRRMPAPLREGDGRARGDASAAGGAAGDALAVDVAQAGGDVDGVGGLGDELAEDDDLAAALAPIVVALDGEELRPRRDGDLAQLRVLDRVAQAQRDRLEAAGVVDGAAHVDDRLGAVGAKHHRPRGVERERAALAAQAGRDGHDDLVGAGPQGRGLHGDELAQVRDVVAVELLALLLAGPAHAHGDGLAGELAAGGADRAGGGGDVGPGLLEVDGAVELDEHDAVAALDLTLVAVGGIFGLVADGQGGGQRAGDGGARGLEGPGERAIEALAVEVDDAAGEAGGVAGTRLQGGRRGVKTRRSGVFQKAVPGSGGSKLKCFSRPVLSASSRATTGLLKRTWISPKPSLRPSGP